MIGRGTFTSLPKRRLQIMAVSLAFWQVVVCILGLWWGSLLLKQARMISDLQPSYSFEKIHRMLFWESSVFFLLLFGTTAFLAFIMFRDYKRSRQIEAFFASFTHELKTPLTSIRLQAESIADDASPSVKKNISRLLEDTQRLQSQVEKTLELSRIEGGGIVYNQPLRIKPLIERFIKNSESDFSDRLKFDLKVDDVIVDADENALQIIFRNLLENAFRHSKKEKLHVSISSAKIPGKIKDQIEVSFSDDGVGFSGAVTELGKIFKKGRESQGTGVGLYLIRTLMMRMGGYATFTKVLPQGFKAALFFNESKGESNA